jgi:hypothetical protein
MKHASLSVRLETAHQILCRLNAPGLLFGSALPKLFCPKARSASCVDILVMSEDCAKHPHEDDGNAHEPDVSALDIEWWVAHRDGERPTNDNWDARAKVMGEQEFDDLVFARSRG